MKSLECGYLGWSMRNEKVSQELSIGDQFLIEQGQEIGKMARTLYPDGILVNEKDIVSATRKTEELMKLPETSVLFEASFIVDSYATKADILIRVPDGWHLIEAKSGLEEKPDYIEDVAYTTLIINRSGVNITQSSLLLLSKDYRLGMDNKDLFVEVDCTDKVQQRVEVFDSFWDKTKEITSQGSAPEHNLQLKCRKCDIFSDCEGKETVNHIFDIPRLSQGKFDNLIAEGIVCINDIPDGFDLTDNQEKVVACVKSGKAAAGSNLESALSSILWPAFYLDFETVMTAIPLYADIAPHTQIPTQYSIHKCSSPSQIDDHYEYLADPIRDCRRELAERLVNDLKGDGSIIVYSSFEKSRINNLIKVFPELSGELNGLLERLVDLEAIIKNNFNHPAFHGKSSIKQTLPALFPEMTYDGLEISDGLAASTHFAYLALGKYEDKVAKQIKNNLLTYCKQDTLGMVKLHEQLAKHI